MIKKFNFRKIFKRDIDLHKNMITVNISELKGLKILHLSDLHIKKSTSIERVKYIVNLANSSNTDITIISGDIIDSKVDFIADKLKLLSGLKPPVYYVSGNHDLFYGYRDLNIILEGFGFKSLDNSIEILSFGGKEYLLAGLSDRYSKFFGISRDELSIVERLKEDSRINIFVAHQPKDYKYALDSNTSLFLAGHTHGGQIYPFHYLVRLSQPFISGLHYRNSMAIYVNSGVGTWGIDKRFKADAEITTIGVL